MKRSKNAPRSGQVAIVGRPNVGKSTLINALVGEKISIVSAKPHTTRNRILGILNREGSQAVFVDTPGHERRSGRALHRLMARAIHQALEVADLVLLMIEAKRTTEADRRLFQICAARADRTILVINKIDDLKSRTALLPRLENFAKQNSFLAYVPVAARTGENLPALVAAIFTHLPEGDPLYPLDMLTDKDTRFRAAETIRERLIEALRDEVPYGLTVEIEELEREATGRWLVSGLIWVEREGHKPIVIGKDGQLLKHVGTEARRGLERLLGDRTHLTLWVKVREHWSDNERELARLGFDAP